MHFRSYVLAAVAAAPLASAQLHQLAKEAGLLYFGTATDNGELNNTQYVKILTDTKEFGQLTPSNGQKVHFPSTLETRATEWAPLIVRTSGLPLSHNKESSTSQWDPW